jgi:hypothetical protein
MLPDRSVRFGFIKDAGKIAVRTPFQEKHKNRGVMRRVSLEETDRKDLPPLITLLNCGRNHPTGNTWPQYLMAGAFARFRNVQQLLRCLGFIRNLYEFILDYCAWLIHFLFELVYRTTYHNYG